MIKVDYPVFNKRRRGGHIARLHHDLNNGELSTACKRAIRLGKLSPHRECYKLSCPCACHKEKA